MPRTGSFTSIPQNGRSDHMSDGTNRYNRLLGYILWVTRSNGERERVYFQRPELMVCPVSDKKYKITERNLNQIL